MQQQDIQLVNRLKLSMQRALLGMITPNIRAIIVELVDKNIQIYFYFDGNVQEDDNETASIIGTEVIADFDEGFDLEITTKQLDFPQQIKHPDGIPIFFRKENMIL